MKHNYTKTILAFVIGLLFNLTSTAQLVATRDYGETPYQLNSIMVIPNVLGNDTLNGVPVTPETVILQPLVTDSPYISIESDGSVWITPTAMFSAGVYTAFYRIVEIQNPFHYAIGAVTINVSSCLTPEIVLSDIVQQTCETNASVVLTNLPSGSWVLRTWRNGVSQPVVEGSGSTYAVSGIFGAYYHFSVYDLGTNCQSVTTQIGVSNSCFLDIDYVPTYVDYNANGYVDPGDLINYSFTVTNSYYSTLISVTVDAPGGSVIVINGAPIPAMAPGDTDSTTFTGYQVILQEDINNGYVSDHIGVFGTEPPMGFVSSGTYAHMGLNVSDGIKLIAFVDHNGNGLQDIGEPNFTHGTFTYEINNNGIVQNIATSNGNYYLYETNPLTSYDLNYTFDSNYPFYTVGAASYTDITVASGSGITEYKFPITIVPHDDLVISVTPHSAPPRPGMQYQNKVRYKNLGTSNMSGTIMFNKDAQVTITNISEPGAMTTAEGFTYSFVDLMPEQVEQIIVTMQVPPIPQVTTGSSLINSASITIPENDVTPLDNVNTLSQVIVNSFDPNDKAESHGPTVEHSQFSSNDYLTYTIRFENTGTASAINIKVEDLLDSNLDETTVRMVDASHEYVLNRVGSSLKWTFAAIDLPPSVEDTNIGKGYIVFQVKPKAGYAVGDIIPNSADIYFDFNPAIVTNICMTEFVPTLSINEFDLNEFAVYPNPTQNIINISSLDNLVIDEVIISDILGKTLLIKKANTSDISIDLSTLSSGMYSVKLKTTDGENTIKVVKE